MALLLSDRLSRMTGDAFALLALRDLTFPSPEGRASREGLGELAEATSISWTMGGEAGAGNFLVSELAWTAWFSETLLRAGNMVDLLRRRDDVRRSNCGWGWDWRFCADGRSGLFSCALLRRLDRSTHPAWSVILLRTEPYSLAGAGPTDECRATLGLLYRKYGSLHPRLTDSRFSLEIGTPLISVNSFRWGGVSGRLSS